MAKVTEEYVRSAFYRRFRRMTRWQREGIIEALTTIHDCQIEDDAEPAEAPELLRAPGGDGEEPEG